MQTGKAMAPHRLMLMAVFFVGLAHLAFLPPFEGFDEEAHWSSITLIAAERRIPVYGADYLDRAVDNYAGPHPYASTPPFDETRGLNYREFDVAARAGPRQTRPDTPFSSGREPNWQAQHPPLYYAILSLLHALISDASWSTQFFFLRLSSWIMAFTGLVIGVEAALRHGALPKDGAMIMAAWPFLFPQFFPEMARMGNDSLCLFFMGWIMVFLLRLEQHNCVKSAAGLALALGLGLWTKAFFLPVVAGLVLYLLWTGHHRFRKGRVSGEWVILRFGAMSFALLLGWGWYLYKMLSTGTVTGGDEFIRLGEGAAGLSALVSHFSLFEFLRGLAAIAASFAWAGSWSLARPNEFLILAPVLLLILTLTRWGVRWSELPHPARATLFIASPMVLGLVFHLLTRTAAGEGGGGTPGWYLHILAPVVGIAVAWGWRRSALAITLSAFTLVFTLTAWTLQLSMFSGCAAKLGENKHYSFEGATCFIQASQLQALGFPILGLCALVSGAGLGACALIRACKQD